jgi:hypothetical protein
MGEDTYTHGQMKKREEGRIIYGTYIQTICSADIQIMLEENIA